MKHKILGIYDSKAGYYRSMLHMRSIGEAERAFQNEVNDPKSWLNKNPEDYGLHLLGEYDEVTGAITPEIQPKHLITAIHLLKKTDLSPVQ